MKALLSCLVPFLALTSCEKPVPTRPAELPDNVSSDKPIVMKEGQALVFMKEGNPDLTISVGLVDGRLHIMELDQATPHFEVIWKDTKKWETTTTTKDGETTTLLRDRNMDGIPDLKAVISPTGTKRYDRIGEQWLELKSTRKKDSATESNDGDAETGNAGN